jgi:hypothetical protein
VSPPPITIHGFALATLTHILMSACPDHLVVLEGAGVTMTRFQYRVPVEVASPRTKLYDRNRKKDV